ncbi:helix-turn-helix domain-containing protein, partial [Micromonospora sp. NPDC004336]
MTPPPPGPQLLGPLLAQLRLARGWSQLRLAAELCRVSGAPTLSRHEVSRWERQLRLPGPFWLGWLAVVLAVPADLLADAAARTRRLGPPSAFGGARSRAALLALAQRWLADPRDALLPGTPSPPATDAGDPPPPGSPPQPADSRDPQPPGPPTPPATDPGDPPPPGSPPQPADPHDPQPPGTPTPPATDPGDPLPPGAAPHAAHP